MKEILASFENAIMNNDAAKKGIQITVALHENIEGSEIF
jgi:hypothetical protein